MSTIKAFVSYSWSTEQKTSIVDTLGQLCNQRGISLIRDNQVLKHGQLIDKFMDEISKGDHVITVFSEPYFQSTWCMYELLKIYQRGDFEAQTHPIIADDCNLQEMSYRLDIVKFWVNQYATARNAIDGIDPALIVEEQKRVNLYRDISQNISDMVNFAAKRMTTPLAVLKQQNYAPLLDRIKLVDPTQMIVQEISDTEFLNDIRLNLELDLKKFEPFYLQVQDNCGIEIGGELNLSDYLVEQCLAGGFVPIIQSLESAFVNCFDHLGKNDLAEFKKLDEAAYGSVTKLVLFNIENEWMSQYREICNASNVHEYHLPKMSLCGVEIILSRQGRSLPVFRKDKNIQNLQPEKVLLLESGIKSKDVVRDLIRFLYARVMGHELAINMDENEAISKLKITIQQRKQHPNFKLRKNYFLLFPTKDSHSALSTSEVQNQLKQLLPDLAFVRLKSENLEKTFIIEDLQLTVAIEEFFKTLEEKRL